MRSTLTDKHEIESKQIVELLNSNKLCWEYLLANDDAILKRFSSPDMKTFFVQINEKDFSATEIVSLELGVAVKICLWTFDRCDDYLKTITRGRSFAGRGDARMDALLYQLTQRLSGPENDWLDASVRHDLNGLAALLDVFYNSMDIIRVMEQGNKYLNQLIEGN